VARRFSSHHLRERRALAGLKPEELALRINRTAATVRALERGYTLPSVPVLAALADALDCSVDALFTTIDLPEPALVAA